MPSSIDRLRRMVSTSTESDTEISCSLTPFDQEALRGLDILEVDGPEGGLQRGDHIDEFVGVVLFNLDIEYIDTGEFLEQHRLAFHHRAAVADDPDQVTPGGEAKGIERILDDRLAGCGNARRIRQGQVALVDELLGRGDRDFSRYRKFVIIESVPLAVFRRVFRLHRCSPLTRWNIGAHSVW